MKKNAFTIFMVLFFAAANFAQTENRSYNLKDFTGIEANNSINLIIKQSKEFKIEANALAEDLDDVKVTKSGDQLKIDFKRKGFWGKTEEPIIFKIFMPVLKELELSGGGYANIEMNLPDTDLETDLSGGCELEGKLNYRNIKIELSGGCKSTLSGNVKKLDIEGSGGTSFKLKELKAENVDADLSGATKAEVFLTGSLNADLSGVCSIKYYGNPTSVTSNSSGFSTVKRGD